MVCQNCGSNDIVTIQGQSYCINCGQLVDIKSKPKVTASAAQSAGASKARQPKVAAAVRTSPVKGLAASKPTVKKTSTTKVVPIKPITPKAPALKPRAFKPTSPKVPMPPKTPEKSQDIAVRVAPIINHSRKAASVPAAKAPKSLNDITASGTGSPLKPAHRQPQKPVVDKPMVRPARPAHVTKKAADHGRPAASHDTDLRTGVGAGISAAFKAIGNLDCWRFGFPLGLLFLGSFFASRVLVQEAGDSDQVVRVAAANPGMVQVAAAVLACLVITYLYKAYARTAIAYGFARSCDHRPVRIRHWRLAGLESTWPVVGIDVLVLVLALPLLAMRWAMGSYVEPAVYQPGLVELLVSVVGNLLLLYAGLGLLIGSWLARYAVALGGMSSHKALKTGLHIYFGQFTKVLWSAIIGLIGAALITVVHAGGLTLLNQAAAYLPHNSLYLLAGGLIGTSYIGAMLIAGSAYGMTIYRGIVAEYMHHDLVKLIAGRQGGNPRSKAVLWLAITGTAVIGLVLVAAFLPQLIISLLPLF